VPSRSATVYGGTVIVARATGGFSIHGVIVTGVDRAPTPHLLGKGRPEPPSPLDVMWNSSMESSVIAHHEDGVPLWVNPMKSELELLLLG
jgi:hypothetical protein